MRPQAQRCMAAPNARETPSPAGSLPGSGSLKPEDTPERDALLGRIGSDGDGASTVPAQAGERAEQSRR
ncbi:hypothetical protein [Streptomyces wedmorensis]